MHFKEYDWDNEADHDFSRVVHHYTDAKSGFTTWKGMVEERLI
jgi:hypothetical protein